MEVQCLNIISKKFYPTKRVTDGLLLLLPIKGVLEIQQFTANVKIDTEVLIVNHTEIFSIKRNETTILLYIASDWFLERGYSFFDYQYNSKLIQSTAQLTKSLIELTKHYLNHTLSCDIYENYMVKIVEIIANEAKVDSNYLPQQTDNSYFGITGEILDYVSRNLKQPLTLKSIANHIFISQSNISSQFYSKLDMNFKTYVDTLKLATSMKELLNGQYTIGEISDLYGFSSAALYSKKFKQYYGYTPNQYRKLTKYNKNLYYPYETLDDTFKDQVKSQLTTKLANSDVQNNEITICSDYFSDNRNSSIIIQIYTITELYQLYTDPKMNYLIENDNQVYIYCNINVKVFQKYISEQQTYKA
ncbi:AraC family transcriptional regulator, partial [Staphylococcus cohnii]|uniref:helix-turn-helix transcriptional regulator n=1 Tax=Staphylococcus cohnii TaxID=29382 RepID=UPI000D45F96B